MTHRRRCRTAAGAAALGALAWIAAPASGVADTRSTELNNQGVTAAQAGRFDDAVALLRQATVRDPADATARVNLSAILTDWGCQLERAGKLEEAEAALRDAAAIDPNNGIASASLGDLLYLRRSDLEGAIRAWERAYGRVPAEAWRGIASRLSQAKRDRVIEQGLSHHTAAHFEIRSQQPLGEALATLIEALEGAHAQLTAALGGSPPPINVIVYAGGDLARVYAQRDWAIGFYDGRIRVRADDIAQPYFADVIAHELAHAFLHHLYGAGVPTWVHEGYAQSVERSTMVSPEIARAEAGVRDRTQWVPLKWLDRRFEQPSGADDIVRAYAESRVVVRRLIEVRGMPAFRAFLQELGRGAPVDRAFDAAFAPLAWAHADAGKLD